MTPSELNKKKQEAEKEINEIIYKLAVWAANTGLVLSDIKVDRITITDCKPDLPVISIVIEL